jgi:hypothetical protein
MRGNIAVTKAEKIIWNKIIYDYSKRLLTRWAYENYVTIIQGNEAENAETPQYAALEYVQVRITVIFKEYFDTSKLMNIIPREEGSISMIANFNTRNNDFIGFGTAHMAGSEETISIMELENNVFCKVYPFKCYLHIKKLDEQGCTELLLENLLLIPKEYP